MLLQFQALSFWVFLSRDFHVFLTAATFGAVSVVPFWPLSGFCGHTWMSDADSSSDTTHEAILNNLVAHQRRVQRQINILDDKIEAIQTQLNTIQILLQQLLRDHGILFLDTSEANRGHHDDQ